MTDETGKALTTAQSKELASHYDDLGIEDRAGEGQEGATSEDYAMPFLALLQSGSPQVKRTDPRCVEGASEGMFMNTVDKELFPGEEGVPFVPCAYRRAIVEWITREEGGGYVGEYLPGAEPATVTDEKNRDIIKESGHELKDTRYWYGFVIREDGSFEPAVIGMTRTQLKPSKAWFNLASKNVWPDGVARTKAPPFYVWTYILKSIPQQKDEFSFWNFEVTRGVPVLDAAIIEAAKTLHDSVKAGQVKAATDSLAETEGDADDAASGSDSY